MSAEARLPKEVKPHCLSCGKPLRPYRWRDEPFGKELKREWGDYGDGAFCGLRCGYHYGKEAAKIFTERKVRD